MVSEMASMKMAWSVVPLRKEVKDSLTRVRVRVRFQG